MAGNNNLPDQVDPSVNYTSLLIIDKNGRLLRLNCPFKVVPKSSQSKGLITQTFWVEAVRPSEDMLMVYIIQSKPYPYSLFIILIG